MCINIILQWSEKDDFDFQKAWVTKIITQVTASCPHFKSKLNTENSAVNAVFEYCSFPILQVRLWKAQPSLWEWECTLCLPLAILCVFISPGYGHPYLKQQSVKL